MRMSDAERCDLLVRILEELIILTRDHIEEISQYREIDGRENDLLEDAEAILGREVER